MPPLPTHFRHNAATYTQLCRHGDLALFAVQPALAWPCTYEVVRLREETYPHDAPYGGLRWPCADRAEGEAFLAMVLRQVWHTREVSHAATRLRD
jgi:hypothetical protein